MHHLSAMPFKLSFEKQSLLTTVFKEYKRLLFTCFFALGLTPLFRRNGVKIIIRLWWMILAIGGLAGQQGWAQNIAITATGAAPNASAMLDVNATNRGLLIPRMTYAQRTTPGTALVDGSGNLPAAAQGLIVYQTNTSGGFPEGFYYNTSTTVTPSWNHLFGGTGSSVRWNEIIDPNGNLSLTHGTNTTTFNFANTTTSAFTMAASALTSGTLLNLTSSNATTTGNVLYATSNSTGAAANGLVRFNFTGAHTGNGLQINDVTTTGNAVSIVANSVTTGNALNVTSNGLTTGSGIYLSSSSTAGTGSGDSRVLEVGRSGANANASHTAYGFYSAVTNTGVTSTNVGGYFSASGATNNYGLIVNSGNVGIGTTTPLRKLEIALSTANTNTVVAPQRTILTSTGTPAAGFGLVSQFALDNSVNSAELAADVGAVWIDATSGAEKGAFIVRTRNSNVSSACVEKMRINHEGNMGIGTTAPAYGLVLQQGNQAGASILINNSGISYPNGEVLEFASQGTITSRIRSYQAVNQNNAQLEFYTTDNSVSSMKMVISNDGKVGIGTAAPDQLLELSGGGIQLNGEYGIGFIGDSVTNSNTVGDKAKIYYDGALFGGANDGLVIEKTDANHLLPDGGIAFANKGSDNLRNISLAIRGDGNVGIGTTNPGYKLQVAGGTVAGAGAYVNTSFSGYKKDFREVNSKEILEKINQLKIQSWVYKPEHVADDPYRHIAPFAEDFYDKFHLGKNDTVITTLDMAGVGLIGIQELAKQANVQNRIIEQLLKENNTLRTDVSNLKSQIFNLTSGYDKRIKNLEQMLGTKAEK